jgi:CheY-like chemotaxis protein
MDSQKRNSSLILMADDDNDYHRFTSMALQEIDPGVVLRRVEDGEELLDYLLGREKYQDRADSPVPNLIFLDLNMPKKNGLEALREIRSHQNLRSIPVIMLTISNNEDDVVTCYATGANSFATKPAGFDELVNTLKVFKQYWFETVKLPNN